MLQLHLITFTWLLEWMLHGFREQALWASSRGEQEESVLSYVLCTSNYVFIVTLVFLGQGEGAASPRQGGADVSEHLCTTSRQFNRIKLQN